jgi:hypothetical protein
MTLRMELAYVALAALALLIADVAAARAAMYLCNAEPWRCRYSPDGRQYFYAAGTRTPVSTATSSTGAGTATSNQAWGCGATDGTARGRSWGFPNKAAASLRALSECAKSSTHCHIVSCSSSVHNYNEAGAILYSDAHR